MPALAKRIEIGEDDRAELERIVRSGTAQVRVVERAEIVLQAAEGYSAAQIGRMLGCSENTVQKWRARYEREGISGLDDMPRSGKPLVYSQKVRARLIAKACTRPPASAVGARQERWTYEQLGEAIGMSASQAHTILSRAEIKPHLTDYWIMSDFSQPEFEERLTEVCGLYVNPPENVLVVSLDEKTGIQAKAPTKPDKLPAPGRPARREHEYKRNGTQCLFPAVKGQKIVAVSDNLSTRGTQEVTDWLKDHPRWSFQFTPTHASWLNQVEIFFSILHRRLLKHGTFTSEDDLAEQMLAFIETYNQTAKPFKWTYRIAGINRQGDRNE